MTGLRRGFLLCSIAAFLLMLSFTLACDVAGCGGDDDDDDDDDTAEDDDDDAADVNEPPFDCFDNAGGVRAILYSAPNCGACPEGWMCNDNSDDVACHPLCTSQADCDACYAEDWGDVTCQTVYFDWAPVPGEYDVCGMSNYF